MPLPSQEYAQGMHGDKIDQIASPLPVRPSFLPSNRRLVDYRCGGSFALALDGALCLPLFLFSSTKQRRDETRRGHQTRSALRLSSSGRVNPPLGSRALREETGASRSGRDRQTPDRPHWRAGTSVRPYHVSLALPRPVSLALAR